MKNKTCLKSHLTIEEIQQRLNEAHSIDQYKRWQVIFLRFTKPNLSVEEVASICGVKYRTVTQWSWIYNSQGPDSLILLGRGGRRRGLLELEEEREILKSLETSAKKGRIVTARLVKQAVEKRLGCTVSKDYAYDVLHRHKWRKVVPRPQHPNQNKDLQTAFKKASKTRWIPAEISSM